MKRNVPTTVEVLNEGPTRTCQIRGAIEAWNCADIIRQIDPLASPLTLVDLAGVKELDSTGLGALIDIHQQVLHGGGQLAFTNPSPAVRRLLLTTRLFNYFTVLEGEDAVARHKAQAVTDPVTSEPATGPINS